MFYDCSSIELVAADIEEGGSLGLVALAPFQSDVKHPAGDRFHGDHVRFKRKVIGNGAACRQISFGIRPDAAGTPAGADAKVLGLDQSVTNYGGALQAVAEFPDVAGPSVGN